MATAVEQIKERLAIDEVVSSYMKLEKAGKNLKGKCPFHSEKTPSFYVSPDRGSFYCFGCGAKGDIFSFVEQFEGLDFMGALKLLAEKAGVDLEAARRAAGFGRGGEGGGAGGAGNYAEIKNEKERLYAIMEDAAHFFETALAGTNPVIQNNTTYNMAATEAREYVKKRGITDETVKKFRIGFIPNEWRLLYTHLRENLKEKNILIQILKKLGLGSDLNRLKMQLESRRQALYRKVSTTASAGASFFLLWIHLAE